MWVRRFTLGLPHEELAQLRMGLGFRAKDVMLERGAMAKPRGSEGVRHPLGLVQIGDRDLDVDDVFGA
jgi:hypothetical protein